MKRKLTASKEAKIRARRAQGVGFADLRREFGLGMATIHRALKGATPPASKAPAELVEAPPSTLATDEPIPTPRGRRTRTRAPPRTGT
jgi:hypothetical protein